MHGTLAIDTKGLDQLKLQAREAPERALKEAARQFEVMFMQMLLKSMREANPQDGPFASEETRLYTSMLDQQLAQTLSARGMGLADVMVKQLQRLSMPADAGGTPDPAAIPVVPGTVPQSEPSRTAPGVSGAAPLGEVGASANIPARAREFVNRMWPHAVEAGRMTGLPPHFILGQAALESGWGQREIRSSDGTPSHNLFGIKATRAWTGATADATTTEYVAGEARKSVERFRAYGSYADAFRDYANLLRGNPRYAGVLAAGNDAEAFARSLQQAGYATDPAYADKLSRLITGAVLRQGLTG